MKHQGFSAVAVLRLYKKKPLVFVLDMMSFDERQLFAEFNTSNKSNGASEGDTNGRLKRQRTDER